MKEITVVLRTTIKVDELRLVFEKVKKQIENNPKEKRFSVQNDNYIVKFEISNILFYVEVRFIGVEKSILCGGYEVDNEHFVLFAGPEQERVYREVEDIINEMVAMVIANRKNYES